MLCQYCRLVTFDPERLQEATGNQTYGRRDTYPDLPALTESALSGCNVCRLLRECIQAKTPLWAAAQKLDIPLMEGEIHIRSSYLSLENGALNGGNQVEQDGVYRITFFANASFFQGSSIPLPFDVTSDEGKLL